ncbi:MAG: maleylpyruvate isomerase N-terminal domain-containing protein, partial [Actinomycetota bacterium]
MTMTREELLAGGQAEREALGRTVQRTDPKRVDGPSPCAGWSSTDILAHLAGQEAVAASLVSDEPASELDAFRAQLAGAPFTLDG